MSMRNPEFDEYQRAADSTAKQFSEATTSALYAVVGLAGEVGEVAEHIKKAARAERIESVNKDALTEEIGDVLWYLSRIATIHGIKLSDVARGNIAKVRARYPRGYDVNLDLARQGVSFPELEDAVDADDESVGALVIDALTETMMDRVSGKDE